MVKNYHPDRVSHLGEERTQEAHLSFLEIMEAYQELEKMRGL
jgi:DnaJ like chaperone protein